MVVVTTHFTFLLQNTCLSQEDNILNKYTKSQHTGIYI